ncbi:MAG: hypothetical protein M0P12_06030 [Paludibacteraceae bacterium]|nr:hypothetical protein [Paludibacteraceae bacterium]
MNHIMRYVGLVLILIGVLVLGLYYFAVFNSNGALLTAAILMVVGLIGHIIANKIFLEDK